MDLTLEDCHIAWPKPRCRSIPCVVMGFSTVDRTTTLTLNSAIAADVFSFVRIPQSNPIEDPKALFWQQDASGESKISFAKYPVSSIPKWAIPTALAIRLMKT